MTSRAQYRELFSCIRGATAVEFAIILPLFLLILFGIISLGFAFFIWNDMTNAAREGARRLSVDDTITEVQAEAIVHDWLAPWPATFEVTACKVAAQTSNPTKCTGTDAVSVLVTAPINEVSIVGSIVGLSTKKMSASVIMRKEAAP